MPRSLYANENIEIDLGKDINDVNTNKDKVFYYLEIKFNC